MAEQNVNQEELPIEQTPSISLDEQHTCESAKEEGLDDNKQTTSAHASPFTDHREDNEGFVSEEIATKQPTSRDAKSYNNNPIRRFCVYIKSNVKDDILGNWIAGLPRLVILVFFAFWGSGLKSNEKVCLLLDVACPTISTPLVTDVITSLTPTLTTAPTGLLTPLPTPTTSGSPTPTPEIVSTPVPSSTPRCPNPNQPISLHSEYRVEAGDCLSCIALRAQISLQELLLANPHKDGDPDFVLPGEIIQIP